jgi:hypothetical protein
MWPNRKWTLVFLPLAGVAAVVTLLCWGRGDSPAGPAPADAPAAGVPPAEVVYDVERREVPLIRPGTVIDRTAPPGWTHLVALSHPRPGTGDVGSIPALARPLTTLISTAMLARVEAVNGPGGARYRLFAVGQGLGTHINGRLTIVSPDTQRRLGAGMGPFAQMVLRRSYAKLLQSVQVARSETMAILDAPVVMIRDGRHKPVLHRQVVLVDPRTGRLETLVWAIDLDEQGRYRAVSTPAVWLRPNSIQEVILHVDRREFTLGMPSDNAFGLSAMPSGQKQIPLPNDLLPLAAAPRLSAASAGQLNKRLWELLGPR